VGTQYYHVNDKPVCESCRGVVMSAAATPRTTGPLIRGGIFGLGAAIAGAAIYYAVIAIANLEIGIVAILIGYMVGYAVRKGAGGRGGRRFQILAVVLTYWSVGLAYAPLAFKQATKGKGDDTASSFSNAGTTPDKVVKPEVSTFGEHVQAALPASSYLASQQKVSGLPSGYGQMSGTSMSTGVAAGAIALLRALHPSWTPGQVKGALVATRSSSLGELRLISAAMQQNPADATKGLNPSLALAVAYAQEVLNTHDYANVTWSDVTWSDVTWSDVTWSDVTWSDVASAVQGAVTWSDVTWSDVTWSDVTWSDVTWSDSAWSDVTWSDNLGAG